MAPAIAEALERAGGSALAEPVGFMAKGRYGPLREGEAERAQQ